MKIFSMFYEVIVAVGTFIPCYQSAKVLNNYSLKPTVVARVDTTLYPIPAMCHKVCLDDPSCTAVTPFEEQRGLFNCLIADTLLKYSDFAFITGSITFARTVECDTANGFQQVKNVGCIKVGTNEVLQTVALDQCPPGSVMYVPTNLASLIDLRAYLVCAEDAATDLTIYHLDFLWDPANGGYSYRYFPGSLNSSVTTMNSWFKAGEPNNNEPERALYLEKSSLYKLIDSPITLLAKVICQMF